MLWIPRVVGKMKLIENIDIFGDARLITKPVFKCQFIPSNQIVLL